MGSDVVENRHDAMKVYDVTHHIFSGFFKGTLYIIYFWKINLLLNTILSSVYFLFYKYGTDNGAREYINKWLVQQFTNNNYKTAATIKYIFTWAIKCH